MDQIEYEGRWEDIQGTQRGELTWVDPVGPGGLQTSVATIAGLVVATIRKARGTQERVVQVPGWIWTKPLAGSVAAKLNVSETRVKSFKDLPAAKSAVKYAIDRLPLLAAER